MHSGLKTTTLVRRDLQCLSTNCNMVISFGSPLKNIVKSFYIYKQFLISRNCQIFRRVNGIEIYIFKTSEIFKDRRYDAYDLLQNHMKDRSQ